MVSRGFNHIKSFSYRKKVKEINNQKLKKFIKPYFNGLGHLWNNFHAFRVKVDMDELTNNLSLLNNRPRKCNKYLTPLEVLNT